jgi:predicted aspartyl protease
LGHVYVTARFFDQTRQRSVETEALVDTGATFTVLPGAMAEELNLPLDGTTPVDTASGELDLPSSWLFVEIRGREGPVKVLISDHMSQALIGVTTLEVLSLGVDPSRGELRPVRALLY